MQLVRDLLDKQLLDRERRRMGRADGLVLAVTPGEPPRLSWIEVGATTVMGRIHPALGRLLARLARRWGAQVGSPVRIALEDLIDTGTEVRLAVDATESGAERWERWLSRHIVQRIPGGAPKKEPGK